MRKLTLYTLVILFFTHCGNPQNAKPQGTDSSGKKLKILFDATKAEMCGNADWVIDADAFNLGYTNTGRMMEGNSNEANPQRVPTPAQENITTDTREDYWTGALSAWAIDCVKEGFYVETLPVRGRISYGDKNNEQDLTQYQIFVVDEPNIKFEPDEKAAILMFIENGGGLMMIADHDKSDRNRDKWDSPNIWNDFNTAKTIPIEFDLVEISQLSDHFAIAQHPVLDGKYGRPKEIKISAGSQMHLAQGAQALCVTKQSKDENHGVLVALGALGKGRVVALSDSSPADDGTGDVNDKLYAGYTGEVNGDHRKLLMNAIIWLGGK
ncbi:MAG: hypothetical protein NTW54_02110 [Bacteroidetes bacterium]|nr:hypothetical protein [Bacteroidota bacterium]